MKEPSGQWSKGSDRGEKKAPTLRGALKAMVSARSGHSDFRQGYGDTLLAAPAQLESSRMRRRRTAAGISSTVTLPKPRMNPWHLAWCK
jgi:hypothetical protein